MIVGLFLLSRMNASTSHLVSSAFMFVLGLGLGMVMQVLVLAVQNAVDYQDLGVATSGATLFRSIGGPLGTSILGSPRSRADHALKELLDRGMLAAVPLDSGGTQAAPYEVTERGEEAAARLGAERHAMLVRLTQGWEPEQNADLARLLTRLADEIGRRPATELVKR